MHACLARSSRLFKVDRRCPPLLRLAQKRLTLLRGFGPHIGSAVRPVGRRPHLTLSYRNCRWLAPSSSTADGAMRAQQLCRACRDSRPTSSSRCSRCLVPSLFPRPIDRHPFAISSMPIMNCGLSHVHTTIGSLFSRRVSTLRPSCNLTPACLVFNFLYSGWRNEPLNLEPIRDFFLLAPAVDSDDKFRGVRIAHPPSGPLASGAFGWPARRCRARWRASGGLERRFRRANAGYHLVLRGDRYNALRKLAISTTALDGNTKQ
eukprot:scaffold83666_cov33-Tisochrysis_lutea.AAC.3